MLSEKKHLLRFAEVVAMAGAVAAMLLALQSYRKPEPDLPVLLLACAGMAILLLTFLPACMLGGEFVKTVRRPSTWRQRTEGLNSQEIEALIRWAPIAYKVGAVAGVLIAVGTALRFGSITFSENQSVTSDDVTGLALYFSVFYLLALPVLGSAVRMPGTYAQSSDASQETR
jgi:hypothetical protein